MSFGINGPNNIPAIQKSHHANDGGAGNLGYFQQERKQKEKKQEEEDTFEFSSSKDNEDENNNNEELFNLNSIGNKIKNWFNSKNKNKENPESI